MLGPAGDLGALAAGVDLPDEEASRAVRALLDDAAADAGGLGRLDDLVAWAAGVQGQSPPRPFRAARVLLVAGEGTAARAGRSTAELLASRARAGVRLVDLPRAGTASTRAADVVADAFAAGVAAVDREVDAGVDLLVPGALDPGATTAAALVAAVLLGREPVEVVDRRSGRGDAAWAQAVTAVRDGLRTARAHADDPLALLASAGSPELGCLTGMCLAAAARRTPVLLDGVVPTCAALVAARAAPRAPLWWRAATLSPDPLHALALARLGLEPLLDLGVRRGAGTGALVALPVVQAALDTAAALGKRSGSHRDA